MTVKEHLVFYGKLKENMGKKELERISIMSTITKVIKKVSWLSIE